MSFETPLTILIWGVIGVVGLQIVGAILFVIGWVGLLTFNTARHRRNRRRMQERMRERRGRL